MVRNWTANLRAGMFMIAAAVVAYSPATGNTVPASGESASLETSQQAKIVVPTDDFGQRSSESHDWKDLYVRVGMGLERSRGTRFLDEDCNPSGFAALYGCGKGNDGKAFQTRGDFGSAPAFEAGIGYAPAFSFLRIEAVIQHRPGFKFKGKANFRQTDGRQDVHMRASALAVMAAAYLDFPGIEVPPIGEITPFAGAGIGQARVKTERMVQEFPGTRTFVPGGTRTNFAWMASTGISTALSERVAMEIAWRYTDLGTAVTGRGGGHIVWRDGSRDPFPLNLEETKADLATHGFWVSLRYAF